MKTGKKLLTGTLLALCAALLVLCSVLAIGWSKAAKTDAALPDCGLPLVNDWLVSTH